MFTWVLNVDSRLPNHIFNPSFQQGFNENSNVQVNKKY